MNKIALVIVFSLFCAPVRAEIVLEPSSFTLDKVKQGDVIRRSFQIFNTSSSDLQISRIYGDCGCVSIGHYPKTVPPYGSAEVGVSFDSNKESLSSFSKTVYITSSAGEKTLEIKGSIAPSALAAAGKPAVAAPAVSVPPRKPGAAI